LGQAAPELRRLEIQAMAQTAAPKARVVVAWERGAGSQPPMGQLRPRQRSNSARRCAASSGEAATCCWAPAVVKSEARAGVAHPIKTASSVVSKPTRSPPHEILATASISIGYLAPANPPIGLFGWRWGGVKVRCTRMRSANAEAEPR
jgi:hypothetical protein